MDKNQAILVLIQVAHGAQKGGILSLKDATTVATAISVLQPEVTPKEEPKEEKAPENA